MKLAQGLIIAAAVFTGMAPAWADVREAAASPEYGRKAGGMIARGLQSVATSPMDLVVHTLNETKTGVPVLGTVVGVVKGAGCTVLRAGSGVVDVATFWIPGFNGFPASESYGDCIGPRGEEMASSSSDGHEIEMDAPMTPDAQGQVSSQPEKPTYSK